MKRLIFIGFLTAGVIVMVMGMEAAPSLANTIDSGAYHNLGVKADGTVVLWGGAGNGEDNVPPDLSGVVAVATMGVHSLALKGDGTVVAWGANNFGQCNVPAGVTFMVPSIKVSIDIKPGNLPSSINPKSQGKIPVAILSTPDFYAPEEADLSTLTFGRTGNEKSLAFCTIEDVNGDGVADVVGHFYTQDTGFQKGDTQGILKGKNVDNIPMSGSDTVRIVPAK